MSLPLPVYYTIICIAHPATEPRLSPRSGMQRRQPYAKIKSRQKRKKKKKWQIGLQTPDEVRGAGTDRIFRYGVIGQMSRTVYTTAPPLGSQSWFAPAQYAEATVPRHETEIVGSGPFDRRRLVLADKVIADYAAGVGCNGKVGNCSGGSYRRPAVRYRMSFQ